MSPTPEQLQEMFAWYQARKNQQIAYPLDPASQNSLGVPIPDGAGSTTLTQGITVGAGGGSFDVPAAYAGSIILKMKGARYEIPYISLP